MDGYYWKLKFNSKKRYDPSQPRVPAGSPEGGRWTAGGEGPSSLPKISMEVDDPQLEKVIKGAFISGKQGSGFMIGKYPGLEKIPLQRERVIATITEGDNVWKVRLIQTAGIMQRAHHHAPMSLHFEKETRDVPDRETIAWWLDRGVITPEQAREEYGYDAG